MSYEYETIADIIRLSEENNISFGDVVMRSELEQYDRSEKEIVKEIKHRLSIFEASIHDGIRHLQRTQSNMSGGDAARLMKRKPLFMSETAYKADVLCYCRSTKLMRKCSELWLAQRRGLVALCLASFGRG